jgi:hypothetical protein
LPRSIWRGRNPFPVIVEYFEPLDDSREMKKMPTLVITSKVTAYDDASPTWLG